MAAAPVCPARTLVREVRRLRLAAGA